MGSFEMAIIYVFPTYKIVLKWSKIDLSKIQIAVFLKALIENSSFLNTYVKLEVCRVDWPRVEWEGQHIWATPLPSKWVFYSIK